VEDEPAREFRLHVAEYQGRGPALLSLATAFLIPDAVDHRIELELILPSLEGRDSRCARAAQVRTWYQTFLLLVYPFKSPAYNRIKSTEALALACLAELLRSTGHVSPSE
jgi:hypothetical protein